MFEKVRKPGRAKSIIAMFIFGAICLVFVFFGMTPDHGGVMMGGAAARVNDSVISFADYRQAVQRMENQYRARLDGLPEAQRTMIEKSMKARALDELIMFELISERARDMGLRVADAEIREQILSLPYFQDGGRFSREKYDQILEANHLKSHFFEDKIRKEMLLNQMQRLFMSSMKALPAEGEQSSLAKGSKLDLSFVSFDRKSLAKKIPVSSSEVEAYLKDAGNKKAVEKYYQDNKASFSQPEEVQAAHILIKADAQNKGSADQALNKIKDIAKQVNPKNFAEVAKKQSQDEGSKDKGGDLGWFGHNRMVKEFEAAAFGLKKGQISEPIKSDFGYHLILLKDRRDASEKSFAQVEAEIARQFIGESRVDSVVKEFEVALKDKNADAIKKIIDQMGLKFQDTGATSVTEEFWPKLGEAGPILDAVFESGVILGFVPRLIQARGSYYVVSVKAIPQSGAVPATAAAAAATPAGAPPDSEMLAMRRANELFDSWYKSEQTKAHIVRSAQVVAEE